MAVDSDKPLTIALEEIAAEKIVAVEPSEDVSVDPLSFIELEDAVIEPLSLVTMPDDDAPEAGDASVDGDAEPA